MRAGPLGDADHAARRDAALVVAVECATATSTCFCTSMGTGPEVRDGADLVLSELDDGFVVRAGSPAGAAILERLDLRAATDGDEAAAVAQVAAVRASIGDPVPTEGLPERLRGALDHPRWAEVAERCLACANCTLVCPTCFCTSVSVASDLDGIDGSTARTWDSCFSLGLRPRRRRRQLPPDGQGPLPPVAHPQVLDLVGPVRLDRLRRLRPLHRLVPGRHRRPRGARRDRPGRRAEPAPSRGRSSPAEGRAPAPARARRAGRPRDRDGRASVVPETVDTVTLRLATSDRGAPRGPARPVRDGRAAGVRRPADLDLPDPPRRPRPDDPRGRTRDRGPDRRSARAPRSRCAARSVAAGRSRRPSAATSSSSPAAIGLAPLRPLIDAILADRPRFGAVRLYLGARTPRDRLFVAEMNALAGRVDVEVAEIVDRAGPEWLGRVGIVTQLFDQATLGRDAGDRLRVRSRADDAGHRRRPWPASGSIPPRTWLTLERNMACGVGTCGHCQLGPFFVCRDGPVFSLAELGTRLRPGGTVMDLPVVPVPGRHPRADDPAPTADRRRQVRLVRRLPADPARPRGRAARDRRAGRHRRVRRGDLAPLVRPVRRAVRRRLDQHRRSRSRRSSGCARCRIGS